MGTTRRLLNAGPDFSLKASPAGRSDEGAINGPGGHGVTTDAGNMPLRRQAPSPSEPGSSRKSCHDPRHRNGLNYDFSPDWLDSNTSPSVSDTITWFQIPPS
jgi:hypothetical protein